MSARPGSLLERMAQGSRERAAAARAHEPEGALLARARAAEKPPPLKLARFDIIAELKLRSPAQGPLAAGTFDMARQLEAYAAGGAAAVSVLTEPVEFGGSLEDLERAATLLRPHGVPVMRKDFLTEPYQVLEARAAGAGGVLVIAAMLDEAAMETLVDCAQDCGLFVLLEAFDAQDLERIGEVAASKPQHAEAPLLVGINSRNLHTLAVEFGRFATLAAHLPAGMTAVAESGIESAEQIGEVAVLGYAAALVGSTLMQARSPRAALEQLLATGRERARAAASCS